MNKQELEEENELLNEEIVDMEDTIENLNEEIEQLEEQNSIRTTLNAQCEIDKMDLKKEFEEETKKIMDEQETINRGYIKTIKSWKKSFLKREKRFNQIDLGYEVVNPKDFDELYNACSINCKIYWTKFQKLEEVDYENKRTWLHQHRYIQMNYIFYKFKITKENFKEYQKDYVILRRVK